MSKKIKGIKLILSTSEDFKLLNGIRFNGKPKAFIQFVEVGEKIISEFCGFDYKDRDKYNLYNNII